MKMLFILLLSFFTVSRCTDNSVSKGDKPFDVVDNDGDGNDNRDMAFLNDFLPDLEIDKIPLQLCTQELTDGQTYFNYSGKLDSDRNVNHNRVLPVSIANETSLQLAFEISDNDFSGIFPEESCDLVPKLD